MKVYMLLALINLCAVYGQGVTPEAHPITFVPQPSVSHEPSKPVSEPPKPTTSAPSLPPTSVATVPTSAPEPHTTPVVTTHAPTTISTPPTSAVPTSSINTHTDVNPTVSTSHPTSGRIPTTSVVESPKPSTGVSIPDHSISINPIVTFTLPGSNGVTAPPLTLSIPSTASGSAVTTLPNSDVVKDVVVTATAQVSGSEAVVLATVRVTGRPVPKGNSALSYGLRVNPAQGIWVGTFTLPLLWGLW
ncbi:hypothetical protein K7432_003408 [Basidiobolus ranarum]|uniref:Uncharacterized protein n=1 Tax=Basidiobolus ranarum TaxID=34480 RepID=A0ABR2WZW8_9FUNG